MRGALSTCTIACLVFLTHRKHRDEMILELTVGRGHADGSSSSTQFKRKPQITHCVILLDVAEMSIHVFSSVVMSLNQPLYILDHCCQLEGFYDVNHVRKLTSPTAQRVLVIKGHTSHERTSTSPPSPV